MAMLNTTLDVARLTVGSGEAGIRLDRVVSKLLPGLGLRARRRIIEDGRITVDGQRCAPGFKLRPGQSVELTPLDGERRSDLRARVRVVTRHDDWIAVYKPSGMHSAALAGREGLSLEAVLEELFPNQGIQLVNRLDKPTSGLVLAGFGASAVEAFRKLENAGKIVKRYLLIVRGRLPEPLVIRNKLDMARRKKTRVLNNDDPDSLRWTTVAPLAHDAATRLSLAAAQIKKGARHQIRAHLAHAGYPIVGDTLYGGVAAYEGNSDQEPQLHLHHACLELPGFLPECLPEWSGLPVAWTELLTCPLPKKGD